MLERFLITAGIIGLVGFTVMCGSVLQRRKVSKAATGFTDGQTPTLFYFWSEACVPCTMVQTPVLDQLEAEIYGLRVVRIDAVNQPDLANKWGVMTVPTTILLDREGYPIHINNRAVQLPELKQQISELGVVSS